MKTIIPFKSSQLKQFLYLGMVWLALGVFQIWLIADQWWLGLGWIILGLFYLAFYFYRKQKGYVQIDDKKIKKFGFPSKQMNIQDIEKVNYFAEDYIITSKSVELRLNKNYMNDEGLELLKITLYDNLNENRVS